MKKAWLAAVLNALVSGLGYVYVGKRILFGVLLIIAEILGYLGCFIDTELVIKIISNKYLFLSSMVFWFGIIIDAYKSAKEVNKLSVSS